MLACVVLGLLDDVLIIDAVPASCARRTLTEMVLEDLSAMQIRPQLLRPQAHSADPMVKVVVLEAPSMMKSTSLGLGSLLPPAGH